MLEEEIAQLLARRPKAIASLAGKIIGTIRQIRPDFDVKVRTGWGSVNFRHEKAGFICAVFVYPDHVDLIFEQGRLLDSPLLVDNGKVKQVRWIPFRPGEPIPTDEIAILLAEAVALKS
ncbi:MAG: DUF1801 domain-containing protein [Devosia sp.]